MSEWETISKPDDGWETIPAQEFGKTSNLSPMGEKYRNEPEPFSFSNLLDKVAPPQGGSILNRIGYSFKQNPQDKINYLREVYGPENVRLNPSRRPEDYEPVSEQTFAGSQYKQPLYAEVRGKNGQWERFNDDTLSISDIGSVPQMAVRYGPQIAGSFTGAGATPIGQALTSAGGVAAEKVISSMIPGGSTEHPIDTALDVGGTGLLMGLSTKGINVAAPAVKEFFSPSARLARKFNIRESAGTPFAQEAKALEDASGIRLPLSQRYGSPKGYHLEGEARAMNPDLAGKQDAANQLGFANKFEELLQKINPSRIGKGETTKRAFKAIENERAFVQSKISAAYEGALKSADRATFGRPAIDVAPTVKILQDKIDDLGRMRGSVVSEETSAELVFLQDLKNKLNKSGGMSFRELDDLLKRQTSAAAGKGKVLSDAQTAASRRVDKESKEAIEASFLAHAQSGKSSAPMAKSYLEARKQYAEGKEYLQDLGNRSLGKMLNLTEDPTTADIVKAMATKDADDIIFLMPIIKKHDAAAADGIREMHLRQIIEKSSPSAGGNVGEPHYVDFKKLSDQFKLDDAFYAKFKGTPEVGRLVQVKKAIDRLAVQDKSGKGQGFVAGIEQGVSAVAGQNAVFLVKAAIRQMSPAQMGKYLLTEEGQKAIINAANPAKVSPQAMAASVAFTRAFVGKLSEEEMNVGNVK